MRPGIFLTGLFTLFSLAAFAQAIGSWQEHFSWHSSIAVGSDGHRIVAATPHAIFSYDTQTEELSRISTVNGLSASGIQTMACDANTIVIAYQNSQIDIIRGDKILPVNTLRLTGILADKSINSIWIGDNQCLLATGFGIAVLNLDKNEIGDVYVIGNGGAYTKIEAVSRDDQYWYAAGAEGLKRAPLTGLNLSDYRSWQRLDESDGLPGGGFKSVFYWRNHLFVQQHNRLYKKDGNLFTVFYEDARNWNSISAGEDGILITQAAGENTAAPPAGLIQLDITGMVERKIEHPQIVQPAAALNLGGEYWVADKTNGLLRISGNEVEQMVPNSPMTSGLGGLGTRTGEWWAAGDSTVSRLIDGNWENFIPGQTLSNRWPSSFRNPGPLAQTKPGEVWIGSAGDGLLQWREEGWQQYKSPVLNQAQGNAGQYRVSGLAADRDQHLWIANDGAQRGLVVYKNDGSHLSFEIPFFYPGYRLGQLVVDDINQKWIIAPGFGLFCYNQGNSLEQTGDDQWRFYQPGMGKGNLPDAEVLCLAKDHFGFVWVGTSDGIAIIQCTEQVFSPQGCEAVLPVVQSDNFAGYLFKGERVQAIAVDGANRKWVGTRNGIWLISESGDKTIYRFTSSNSPLPDNDVQQISVDPKTGWVLIATAKGMVSYRSTATEGGSRHTNVLVYPNPVPPGYTGTIAIRGLVNQAVIKITTLDGRLVYQGRALGGQAIWNGLDLNGKRVATGVYLVWSGDESRKEQAVTKIVFIQP